MSSGHQYVDPRVSRRRHGKYRLGHRHGLQRYSHAGHVYCNGECPLRPEHDAGGRCARASVRPGVQRTDNSGIVGLRAVSDRRVEQQRQCDGHPTAHGERELASANKRELATVRRRPTTRVRWSGVATVPVVLAARRSRGSSARSRRRSLSPQPHVLAGGPRTSADLAPPAPVRAVLPAVGSKMTIQTLTPAAV